MKQVGDRCDTCPDGKPAAQLIEVNGALVCPYCDNVKGWPSVTNGTARIVRAR